jgi:hypothetical protein
MLPKTPSLKNNPQKMFQTTADPTALEVKKEGGKKCGFAKRTSWRYLGRGKK